MPITITVSHTVSDQTIRDIKTVAAEGGINYWSEIEEYDFDAGVLEINETGDGDVSTQHKITDEVIVEGIKKALTGDKACGEDVRGWIASAVAEDDASHIDAEAADVIVQLGLFGEVVYG